MNRRFVEIGLGGGGGGDGVLEERGEVVNY